VTDEEIARNVIYEIRGGNTGHDIINALDNATMGPTYRAGVMRESALNKMQALMEEHKCDSVAFELLGPPRLSKLLYEAHLLKLIFGKMKNVLEVKPKAISEKLEKLVLEETDLRAAILSIGIPILLSDGKRILRGPQIKIPPFRGHNELDITPELIDSWAENGWIDLRELNAEKWQSRIQQIFKEMDSIPEDDTSSQFERDKNYWTSDNELNIGKVVGWLFSNEEHGLRMKD